MTQLVRRAFAMYPKVPIFTLAPRLVPLWGRDSRWETPSSSRTASPAAERFTFRTPGNSNGQALWGNKPVPTDVIGPRGSEIVCPRQHPVVPAVYPESQENSQEITDFLSGSSGRLGRLGRFISSHSIACGRVLTRGSAIGYTLYKQQRSGHASADRQMGQQLGCAYPGRVCQGLGSPRGHEPGGGCHGRGARAAPLQKALFAGGARGTDYAGECAWRNGLGQGGRAGSLVAT